jgi:hypothetical protein
VEQIKKQKNEHNQSQLADRAYETRLNHLSEESTKEHCVMNNRSLKMDIDGMDNAKYAVPRNEESSKILSNLWRPCLHVVGVIAWGDHCLAGLWLLLRLLLFGNVYKCTAVEVICIAASNRALTV